MMNRSGILSPAAVLAAALFAAAPLAAQTVVVTPANQHSTGWFDNSSSTVTSTGSTSIVASPSGDGDGSLRLTTVGGGGAGAQPALINSNTAVVGGSLSSLSSGGYAGMNYFQDTGAPGNPVFRLVLSGVTGGPSSFMTMGWYGSAEGPAWQQSGNIASSGSFFFRAGRGGQIADNCTVGSGTGSFSDRMQTLSAWLNACNGNGNTYNFSAANVKWIQVDQGSWPGFTGTNNSYVDDVAIGYGGTAGTTTYDFANTTPEPSSIALLGTGLFGLVPMVRRRRKQ